MMAVEDHPLFPKWKKALEDVISAKELLEIATGSIEKAAARETYGHALARYAAIADEI